MNWKCVCHISSLFKWLGNQKPQEEYMFCVELSLSQEFRTPQKSVQCHKRLFHMPSQPFLHEELLAAIRSSASYWSQFDEGSGWNVHCWGGWTWRGGISGNWLKLWDGAEGMTLGMGDCISTEQSWRAGLGLLWTAERDGEISHHLGEDALQPSVPRKPGEQSVASGSSGAARAVCETPLK